MNKKDKIKFVLKIGIFKDSNRYVITKLAGKDQKFRPLTIFVFGGFYLVIGWIDSCDIELMDIFEIRRCSDCLHLSDEFGDCMKGAFSWHSDDPEKNWDSVDTNKGIHRDCPLKRRSELYRFMG